VSDEIIFTNYTEIAAGNTNYEGQDIIIGPCLVMLSGTHTFNSVRVFGTLVITNGSRLNVAGEMAVRSRVVIWGVNTTGQVSNQSAAVGVTINASNLVVAGQIIPWDQDYLPWVEPRPPWGPIRIYKARTTRDALRAPGISRVGPQSSTNAAQAH